MFDISSLLLALTVVMLVMSGVLLLFTASNFIVKDNGIVEMALAMLIAGIGAFSASAGTSSANPYFVFVAAICFVVSVLMSARAMRRLQQLKPRLALEAGCLVIALAANAWFLLFQFQLLGMFVVNSLLFTVISLCAAADLLREKRPELRPGCRTLGFLFAAFALFMLIRAVSRPFMGVYSELTPQITLIDSIAALVGMVAAIVWSVGFLWTIYSSAEYKLKQANEELERFTSSVAHDLKAPLNGITGFLSIVKSSSGSIEDPQNQEYLGMASSAAWRMDAFIDELLSHAQNASAEPAFTSVDPSVCGHTAQNNLHHQLSTTGGEIRIPHLPAVLGNQMQITRLFQNLFDNALKYGAKGRPPVIDVRSRQLNGDIAFTVSDNGIGIPPAAQDRIFNDLERLEPVAGIHGSGVGLAECKRIVESHGGSIWVESVVGEGSTFHFTMKPHSKGAQPDAG